MNAFSPRAAALLLAGLLALAPAADAAPKSDLVPTDTRNHIVALAQQLAASQPLAALPAELPNPFAPPGFDQAAPDEARPATAGVAAPVQPTSDQDILALLASRIVPSGTLVFNGQPMLSFGSKRLRVGDRLTVSYDGKDYDLEIAAISRTTFTLRLNGAEITRPI
jgi:hypothetical protein